jgi:DNA-directed RNA polymerase beta' subunit
MTTGDHVARYGRWRHARMAIGRGQVDSGQVDPDQRAGECGGERGGECGMVTAETALALMALVVVTLGMVWAVTVVSLQARCMDAARDTARAVARGETSVASRTEGRRSAPRGASIDLRVRDGVATVEVAVDARPRWRVLSGLPVVPVSARAVVALEPPMP